MTSIELYRYLYASSTTFQEHLDEMLKVLRGKANSQKPEDYSEKCFLLAFADALQVQHRVGEYLPLYERK